MNPEHLSGRDLALIPVYLVIILFIGRTIAQKNISNQPIYKFYVRGLMMKVLGSIGLCFIYVLYYGGGDTTGFYDSSLLLSKLFSFSPETFFSVLGGDLSNDNLAEFVTYKLCCPQYYRDPQSFSVVRLAGLLNFFGLFSYFTTSMLFAALSYGGSWRLFTLFNDLYPGLERKFAIAILYMPSVLFWGSGILKDTITFSAACWLTYAVYNIFIRKYKRVKFTLILIASAYLLVTIKPYIFVALLPGSAIWITFNRVSRIQNTALRLMVAPATIALGLFLSSTIMGALASNLGTFGSVDQALNKAVVTKNDLSRDVYGKNSFDIGEFDGSVGGAISKFPQAVIAGLYRPFLWEARNLIILISALENSFLFFMTFRSFLKAGVGGVLSRISKEPLLLFSFIFSIFFAFSVGLSTSNFGALVRYKIPCIPFFLSALFILESKTQFVVLGDAAANADKDRRLTINTNEAITA
jgi:hypothetical protein